METREGWIDSLAALPSVDDIQRNRKMHQNQRGPVVSHERVSVLQGTEREASTLSSLQASQNELMADQIISAERLLSQADWLANERLAKMTVRRGPMFQMMGFSSGGCDYFFAEEALFLLETGHLELFYEGLPVTIQQAYSLLLCNTDLPYSTYRVYAHLLRGGYIAYHHRHHQRALARSNPAGNRPPPHQGSDCVDSSSTGNADGMDSGDISAPPSSSRAPARESPGGGESVVARGDRPRVAATPWSDVTEDVACPEWILRNMTRLMNRGEKRLRSAVDDASDPPSAVQPCAAAGGGGGGAGSEARADSLTADGVPAAILHDEHESTRCRSHGSNASTSRHLLAGSDDITKENVLAKLDIFSSPPKCHGGDEVVFDLDIYHHKPGFRKANPGDPNYYICVQGGPQTSAPSLSQIISARTASNGVPVRWAVGDENRVHFYSLDTFSIPTLHPA